MNLQVRIVAALALLCAGAAPVSEAAYAQEIDFGKIDKFESLGTGTLHVGSPPKPIIDDGERHRIAAKGVISYECRHFRFAPDSRLIAVWTFRD
jgi:hypothetical protein